MSPLFDRADRDGPGIDLVRRTWGRMLQEYGREGLWQHVRDPHVSPRAFSLALAIVHLEGLASAIISDRNGHRAGAHEITAADAGAWLAAQIEERCK
ncbi:hypothetical protein ACFQ1E_17480 [Sphingomonas canadensis]|uniref:Uncharacterized protein n=1 Tax=Sphingomonas canadensis TaxID=1219257 RepID=A0ABW3HD62_9SPHN|nr:hypothetical protein [Sphingomonas canadensis]MCW3837839.1 hypothetical protein [Sphingomonas canadensis]